VENFVFRPLTTSETLNSQTETNSRRTAIGWRCAETRVSGRQEQRGEEKRTFRRHPGRHPAQAEGQGAARGRGRGRW
jgi:hypothetical protein